MRSEIESLLFIKGLAARGGGKSLQGETRGRAREKKFNRGGQVPALTPSVAFIALTVLFSLSWEKKTQNTSQSTKSRLFLIFISNRKSVLEKYIKQSTLQKGQSFLNLEGKEKSREKQMRKSQDSLAFEVDKQPLSVNCYFLSRKYICNSKARSFFGLSFSFFPSKKRERKHNLCFLCFLLTKIILWASSINFLKLFS